MNKREFIRYNSLHLVYYSLFDQDMKNCGEGVGRTINISQGGALVELSSLPLGEFTTVVLELALRDSLIKFQGRVMFSKPLDPEKMEVGVQFVGMTDEQRKSLLEFFRRFTSAREKDCNLIRENVTNIDNVVLTLSKEHKIVKDYVIDCRSILSRKGGEGLVEDLETLFGLMEKDLLRHFRFEEEIIFEAALSGEQDRLLLELVQRLKKEHIQMLDRAAGVRGRLASLVSSGIRTLDKETLEKIDSLLGLVKHHAKEEIIHLFPVIDADRNKIQVLNRLLTGVTL